MKNENDIKATLKKRDEEIIEQLSIFLKEQNKKYRNFIESERTTYYNKLSSIYVNFIVVFILGIMVGFFISVKG